MSVSIVLLYASLSALILLALSWNVIRLRRAHRVGLGSGSVPELERATRAHANFCEYVPLALLLMLMVELAGAAPLWALHALGLALVAGRILHALGLTRSAGPSSARVVGMVLTFAVLLLSAGAGIGAAIYALVSY